MKICLNMLNFGQFFVFVCLSVCLFFVFLPGVKSPSVTQRSVYQENSFKKSKNPTPFWFRRTIGSSSSVTSGFKVAKF